jgi:hypothetical protein
MSNLSRLHSGAAVLMLTTVALPTTLLFSRPAVAQGQVTITTIPAGTAIPARYDGATKILVDPKETTPLTLTVTSDVRGALGAILIPAGSKVKGQLQPASGGQQFVGTQITLPNSKVLNGETQSAVITKTESYRKGPKATPIVAGTVVGAAAATGLSALFGGGGKGVKAWRVLAGAGTGAIAGTLYGIRKVDVIAIDPNNDLNLTLKSSLPITYP